MIKAEYALLFGLEMLLSIRATHIEAFGDSLLVVQQISKVFQCLDESLNVYLDKCLDIISTLAYFNIAHISRHDNWRANELAQQASGYHVDHGMFHISQRPMTSFANVEVKPELTASATHENSSAGGNQDWRKPIFDYLRDPSKRVDRTVRRMAFKYEIRDGDLYRRTVDDVS